VTVASPHRPGCRCGGTGLLTTEVPTPDDIHHPYTALTACPGPEWPTPPPALEDVLEVGVAGVAAARAALTKETRQ
jgi:hypothetical protein